jgi:hypothetical protein
MFRGSSPIARFLPAGVSDQPFGRSTLFFSSSVIVWAKQELKRAKKRRKKPEDLRLKFIF